MSKAGDILTALRAQLIAYPVANNIKDSGYDDADIFDLIQKKTDAFFNIICDGWETSQIEGMDIKRFVRTIYNVTIQIGTQARQLLIAKQGDSTRTGLYEFAENVEDAIDADATLGGVVTGRVPGSSIIMQDIEAGEADERYFIGAGEITVQFFQDKTK